MPQVPPVEVGQRLAEAVGLLVSVLPEAAPLEVPSAQVEAAGQQGAVL